MIRLRGALVVVALATTSAFATAGAQMRSITQGGVTPRASCGPFAIVTVSVVNAHGGVVTDARIEVWRKRDKKKLAERTDALTITKEYIIADDLALPLVAPKGEAFEVRITRGKRVTTKALRLRHSADGCHVELVGAPVRIVVPG